MSEMKSNYKNLYVESIQYFKTAHIFVFYLVLKVESFGTVMK